MNLWIVMLAGGLLTFLTRLSFIWFFDRLTLPRVFRRALRFVPPAVLSVIIFQELLFRDGSLFLSMSNARLLAGILAMGVAWRTRNTLLTIIAGMAALLFLQIFIS